MSSFPDFPELVFDGAIVNSLHWGRDGLLPAIMIRSVLGWRSKPASPSRRCPVTVAWMPASQLYSPDG